MLTNHLYPLSKPVGGELVDRKMFIFSEVPVPVLAYRFRLGNLPV
jgi:hypothetical protein